MNKRGNCEQKLEKENNLYLVFKIKQPNEYSQGCRCIAVFLAVVVRILRELILRIYGSP